MMGSFGGLKLDDKGCVTYHGATSFFQLPTDTLPVESPVGDLWDSSLPPREGGQRRERLVNNAWQQRALETFLETPVIESH